MATHKITISRVYEPPNHKEGLWILVDRLWPRGLKKETLDFDLWCKDIAPSPALRRWFNHDPRKWHEFAKRYVQELKDKSAVVEKLLEEAKHYPVTLFYAAKDIKHNHALVLQKVLQSWPTLPDFDE